MNVIELGLLIPPLLAAGAGLVAGSRGGRLAAVGGSLLGVGVGLCVVGVVVRLLRVATPLLDRLDPPYDGCRGESRVLGFARGVLLALLLLGLLVGMVLVSGEITTFLVLLAVGRPEP